MDGTASTGRIGSVSFSFSMTGGVEEGEEEEG
jgi:hypothetical protein